jgi:hypothetical protein
MTHGLGNGGSLVHSAGFVEGLPRWYRATTSSTSLMPAHPEPSAIREKPGPEVAVALRAPVKVPPRPKVPPPARLRSGLRVPSHPRR